jgi:S-(hydroxymethyl)glutathione dehydrogenase/alcohol dehydrogenase
MLDMYAPIMRAQREPLVMEELQIEEPKEGEVMVRMAASGVCHSCLHAWDGSWPGVPVPMVLGDEGAGIIERVGPGVKELKPGDHVVIAWAPTCGRCHYCVTGRPVLCERRGAGGRMFDGTTRLRLRGQEVYHYGGVATYGPYSVIPEGSAVKIRDDMPIEKAALIGCSVMTGVGAVLNTAKVQPGESLAIFGVGGVGLNAVQGGRLISANPLIAVDVADNKLEFARQMGATHLINSAEQDPAAEIMRITGRGVDHAIVTVGSTKAGMQAWESLARGGTCVIVGVPPEGQVLTINPRHTLVMQERSLRGSSYGSARPFEDFRRLVDLYMTGKLLLDELITKTYTIEESNEAFADLAGGSLARGLIVFN